MVGEFVGDKFQHFPRHVIGLEPRHLGLEQVRLGGLSVVVVVIPLAALRLVAIHQDARLLAHQPIEILHAEFLAPLGPILEFRLGRDETGVGQARDLQRQLVKQFDQPPVAGGGADHLLRAEFVGAAQKLPVNGLCVVRVGEPGIGNGPAVFDQGRRELAHRGKDQRDLLRMVLGPSRLAPHLGHDHDIRLPVGRIQRGQRRGQLVAKDEDQAAHHTTRLPCQSKNSPVSSGVRPSRTSSRFAAA